MNGKPNEETRSALAAAISKLDTGDSFNVIAFNHEIHLFSQSLEFATEQVIDKATQWICSNVIAGGDTNISLALTEVKTSVLFFIYSSTFSVNMCKHEDIYTVYICIYDSGPEKASFF